MPFKSEAQKRKFQQLVRDGKLSQEQYDEWDAKTPAKLPERVPPKGKSHLVGLEPANKKRKR